MPTADIYRQHEKAFPTVSAFVILDSHCVSPQGMDLVNARCATVAFRHPRDGASKLWCYVHAFGAPMVRGSAGGYGYDKMSAAAIDAFERIGTPEHYSDGTENPQVAVVARLKAALAGGSGQHWDSRLRDHGFVVLQAV